MKPQMLPQPDGPGLPPALGRGGSHLIQLNNGTVAADTGLLSSFNGTIFTTETVTTPISIGNGNYVLVDDEANAAITQTGTGKVRITELGAGEATISLGDGHQRRQRYCRGDHR